MAAVAIEIERRDRVDGLGKGLRVIEAFDDQHPRLTASQATQSRLADALVESALAA